MRLGVGLLGLVAILAFAASSAYDAWRSYQYFVAATIRELDNTARALAEQTVWTLQAVDLLLLDTAGWYGSDGHARSAADLNSALAMRAAGLEPVRRLTIVDAQGTPLYRSKEFPASVPSVSDRSYFIAQRDDAHTGLFISEPLVTRSEGNTALILSRRLQDANGAFSGVITAQVDLDHLNQFYRAVNLDMGSAVQLVRNDGTLLMRNPPIPDAIGRRFPGFALPPAGAPARIQNPVDGREEFIAVAAAGGTPLELIVTRDAAAALAPWVRETVNVGVRTLVVTLLGLLALWGLQHQIRRVAAGDRALSESEERYALAMEGANEGHWDWDIATDRLFLSTRMKTLGGQPPDSDFASRREWLSRMDIHPEDRPRLEAAVKDHFDGRTPNFEFEYRVRHPNGEWHWVLSRGRLLYPGTEAARFVGSAIDITAQKHAQLEQQRLEAQLRQSHKMEAIGTLAGGIAHDFNNILGAILGYGELAHEHSAGNPDLRRYLDNVMHAARRAKFLVERILGFSRMGFGDQVPVDVQSVVTETLDLLEASLPPGIRLERHLNAAGAAVVGDATYLHQVTMNLCTNAVQAMERGGVLCVTLECTSVPALRTLSRGTLAAGDYVHLNVSDTGAGIPADVIERIFDPFFTTKVIGGGTGLGLSLVHGIVSDLGGAIDVSTTVGEGTHVDIWLPTTRELAASAAELSQALPQGHGEVVMIVDDEATLVALGEEIMARLGYEAVGFESSPAALAALRADPQRFDAVLTDESMPELTGTELVREMRRIRPSLPLILMSGYGGAQLGERAAAVGVDDVLRKPLQQRELAESLARALGSRR